METQYTIYLINGEIIALTHDEHCAVYPSFRGKGTLSILTTNPAGTRDVTRCIPYHAVLEYRIARPNGL